MLALPYQWQLRVERWKSLFRGMFGGGEKRPQLCPACGALVGIKATRCHECGTNLRFGLAAWSKGLSEFFGGHAPVTVSVLIINVLMFGVSLIRSMQTGGGFGLLGGMSGIELYRLGENIPLEWPGWGPWRLIMGTFLHGGLLHIGMNMMVLLDIAPVVEELYGSARFLFLYVACAIGGSACSTFFGRGPSVGASGAILGLIGLLIAVTTRRSGAHIQAMRSRLISWVVMIFAFGFLVRGIDNWGHFGGLATGFVLGKLFADRPPAAGRERTRAYLLGWVGGGVIVAAFVMMFLHLGDPLPH
ncbi:MAG TPA: rhomboid family intramembrane serine protease [Candidatus Sulfotelmatobacter sp.]|nr:rhomboid family intramembrane serine protease [Candidatus Sulfotelmatobacter sp.]